MIRSVYHLLNDKITTLDERRKVLPEYSGKFHDVIDDIMRDADAKTEFYVNGLALPVCRDLFMSRAYFDVIKDNKKEKSSCGS